MTILRLTFAGQIKKVEHKTVGDKQLMTLSVCKKNYAKKDEDVTFTWINVSVWGPLPDFLVNKAIKGAMIAGSGEFMLRGYKDKDGTKAQSADVRCTSFDVEVGGAEADGATDAAPAKAAPRRPAPVAATADDDLLPF